LTAVKSYITHPRTTRLITEMGLRASNRGSRLDHVDLHFHSRHSDGTFTPGQLAQAANFLGLKAVALADHNTHAGTQEMTEECSRLGITNIPAIELSTKTDGGITHLLGYHMTFTCPELLERLEGIQYPSSYPTIEEGIRLIHADKGIPIWAHPWRTHEFLRRSSTEDFFNKLVADNLWGPKGLMGLECPLKIISEPVYSSLTGIIEALMDKGIDPILTWGSDFHGGRYDTFGGDYASKRKAQIILDQLDAARSIKYS